MSKAKYTLGPWKFDPEDESIIGEDEGLSIATIDHIDIGGSKDFNFGEISSANARLIASAPELLEALQAMLQAFGKNGLGGEYDPGEVPAIDQALAARAKALGELS